MDTTTGWTKYVNVLGFLGLLTTILYINPVANIIPAISNRYQSFHNQATDSAPATPFDVLPAQYRNGCPVHKFKSVRQLSRKPDVMLIEGFLSQFEADYLLKIA
jgi:hypothetical protein